MHSQSAAHVASAQSASPSQSSSIPLVQSTSREPPGQRHVPLLVWQRNVGRSTLQGASLQSGSKQSMVPSQSSSRRSLQNVSVVPRRQQPLGHMQAPPVQNAPIGAQVAVSQSGSAQSTSPSQSSSRSSPHSVSRAVPHEQTPPVHIPRPPAQDCSAQLGSAQSVRPSQSLSLPSAQAVSHSPPGQTQVPRRHSRPNGPQLVADSSGAQSRAQPRQGSHVSPAAHSASSPRT